jgi:hypothetical protein
VQKLEKAIPLFVSVFGIRKRLLEFLLIFVRWTKRKTQVEIYEALPEVCSPVETVEINSNNGSDLNSDAVFGLL